MYERGIGIISHLSDVKKGFDFFIIIIFYMINWLYIKMLYMVN